MLRHRKFVISSFFPFEIKGISSTVGFTIFPYIVALVHEKTVCRLYQWQHRNSNKDSGLATIWRFRFCNGHFCHVPLKQYYQSAWKDLTMTSDIVSLPPTNQYCGGGGGGGGTVLHFLSNACHSVGQSLACSQPCFCRGLVGGGGGGRRVSLSTTAAAPAPQ